MGFSLVQKVTQASHTRSREYAKDIPLVLIKLRWGLSAKGKQLVAEKRLHSGEAQVRELRAVVQKNVDALKVR